MHHIDCVTFQIQTNVVLQQCQYILIFREINLMYFILVSIIVPKHFKFSTSCILEQLMWMIVQIYFYQKVVRCRAHFILRQDMTSRLILTSCKTMGSGCPVMSSILCKSFEVIRRAHDVQKSCKGPHDLNTGHLERLVPILVAWVTYRPEMILNKIHRPHKKL